ncbi:Lanosterol synthase (Oxidosqualene--lanosterol cyclase) [Blastocladiella emersonii ATCC 22665]|nr:Lanosterol synthase (Oxidosqualene--lanosterol cyclase) [Blastocladiella emersonii ATCC 22665]
MKSTYYAKCDRAVPPIRAGDATDLRKWRLRVDDGRQWWDYVDHPAPADVQRDADRYWLDMLPETEPTLPPPATVQDAVRNGFRFVSRLQTDDGHWAGEYGGPMFLVPGLVIAWYVTGRRDDFLSMPMRIEMVRYLRSREVPATGGWGIHIESPATVFGTALNYVALRLLGVPADDALCTRARDFLHRVPEGTLGIPSWGKFWLASLGLYSWDGMKPVPPELWLLPDWVPAHPWRMWIHTRMVYLPMGYLYGLRLTCPSDALIEDLRAELYPQGYDTVDWSRAPGCVATIDRYIPESKLGEAIWWLLGKYERVHSGRLRKKALALTLQLVENEDDNTGSLDLGPVNKAMNMLVIFHAHGADSARFRDHVAMVKDFMWQAADGMRMNGTNGSQLWDSAFFCQAGYEAGLHADPEFRPVFARALGFLDACQIRRNAPFHSYRHTSKGAWPFSNRQQSYTVSDCTAEGLKAVLQLQATLPDAPRVTDDRIKDAVDVLLSMPNRDGGFASYELIRGPAILEALNPAEVFGNIMIEYSYPECTTASVLGLLAFQGYRPDLGAYRAAEVARVKARALEYIKRVQEPAGGWYGAWGVCYTYATWFAVESLAGAGGDTYATLKHIRRACDFIAGKVKPDGGWGEHYTSCERHVYVQHAESQVVNTAWAVLTLMRAEYPDHTLIRRGIELILSRQRENGSWRQEAIEGVFNKNCMISYPNYKLAFTSWALARYARLFGNPAVRRTADGAVEVVLVKHERGVAEAAVDSGVVADEGHVSPAE